LPTAEHADRHILVPSRVDRMNHDPGTVFCLTCVVPAWVRPQRPQAGRVDFDAIHGSTHVCTPADTEPIEDGKQISAWHGEHEQH